MTGVADSQGNTWVYQYDALGNLASTKYNGQLTTNLVDPVGVGCRVGQTTNNVTTRYTYGLSLVSQVTATGTNYYQFDALGSTADLVDSTGSILNSYSYSPFGGTLSSTGDAANPFTFIGQFGVSSDGNGWLNMRARSYDPAIGQFTSNDPIGLLGGDFNVRRYVLNGPTGSVDATGYDQKGGLISAPCPRKKWIRKPKT